MPDYHSHAALGSDLATLRASNAEIVDADVVDVGRSVEGRQLWAIKIGKNPDVKALLLGGHHAREWISVEVPFHIARHLVENYSSDAAVTRLVDNREIWVVPMVNPDGVEFSRSNTANRLWRKNRRDNSDGTFGVDLNRNYPASSWGTGTTGPLAQQSTQTSSELFVGPSAGSEAEVRAIVDLMTRESFKAAISYHSAGQMILHPLGASKTPVADPVYLGFVQGLGREMQRLILARHGEHYTVTAVANYGSIIACAPDLEVTGTLDDFAFETFHIPFFTIELRPISRDVTRFILPPSEITPTFEEQLPAALKFIDCAGGLTGASAAVNQPATTVRTALASCGVSPATPGGTVAANVTVNQVNGRELISIVFDNNRSFLRPEAKEDLFLAERHVNENAEIQPFVVGHTDLIGQPPPNDTLSARRARSIVAYLTNDVDAWRALRRDESWGLAEGQYMLQFLGFYTGFVDNETGRRTRDALEAFQREFCLRVTRTLDDDTWDVLLDQYLFARNAVIFPERFERHRSIGCGEQHPLINREQSLQQNRRVEVLFFRGDPDPAQSVCNCDFYPPIRPAALSGSITVECLMEESTFSATTPFAPYASEQIRVYDPDGRLHELRTGSDGRWRLSGRSPGLYTIEVSGGSANTLQLTLVGRTTLQDSFNGRVGLDLRADTQLHIRIEDIFRLGAATRLTPVSTTPISSAETTLIAHVSSSKQPPVDYVLDVLRRDGVRVVFIGENHQSEITRTMTAEVVRRAQADASLELSGVVFEIDQTDQNSIIQGRYDLLPSLLRQPEAKRLITLVRRDDSLDFVAMDNHSFPTLAQRNQFMADAIAAHVNSRPDTKTIVLVGSDHAKEIQENAARFLSDQLGAAAVFSVHVESGLQGAVSNEEIRLYFLLRRQFRDDSFGFDIDPSPLDSFVFDAGQTNTAVTPNRPFTFGEVYDGYVFFRFHRDCRDRSV